MSAPAVRQTGHSGRQFGATGTGAEMNQGLAASHSIWFSASARSCECCAELP